jgi:hypothetical protein
MTSIGIWEKAVSGCHTVYINYFFISADKKGLKGQRTEISAAEHELLR